MSPKVDEEREAISIAWLKGVQFAVSVRGHSIKIDQPVEEGGQDQGITPTEMFVASLGTCIGYFAVRFCQRHSLPTDGFAVRMQWDYREQPHRIGAITIEVDLKGELEPGMKARLQKVLEGCTVHNALTHPPDIAIQLGTAGEK